MLRFGFVFTVCWCVCVVFDGVYNALVRSTYKIYNIICVNVMFHQNVCSFRCAVMRYFVLFSLFRAVLPASAAKRRFQHTHTHTRRRWRQFRWICESSQFWIFNDDILIRSTRCIIIIKLCNTTKRGIITKRKSGYPSNNKEASEKTAANSKLREFLCLFTTAAYLVS